jgi:Papain family cysteine protease
MKEDAQLAPPADPQPATPGGATQPIDLAAIRVINAAIINAAPPQPNCRERQANRQKTLSEMAEFRQKAQAECRKKCPNFSDPHLRTLEQRIKEKIQRANPNLNSKVLQKPLVKLAPLLRRFDWREYHIVPAVRRQADDCASCWAYVATAAFESSAMKERANFNIPLNEDFRPDPVWVNVGYTLNRTGMDVDDPDRQSPCSNGWPQFVFKDYVDPGIPANEITIGTARPQDDELLFNEHYRHKGGRRVKAIAWDYVLWWTPGRIPKPITLKKALLEYGPLAVMLFMNDKFVDYGKRAEPDTAGAPIYETKAKDLVRERRHEVLLIGWDDDKRAWIIQNSYGPQWGYRCDGSSEINNGKLREDRGFMYIRWGSNDIGRYAAWVQARLLGIDDMLQQFKAELRYRE